MKSFEQTDKSGGTTKFTSRTDIFSAPFKKLAWVAPLILRLTIGTVMIAHGAAKLQAGPTEVWGSIFESMGIPVPIFLAWTVTLIEGIGGILLIVGLFTRIAALLFSGIMLNAIFLVSIDLGLRSSANSPGADLNLALMAGALALAFIGPGKIALDYYLGLDSNTPSTDSKNTTLLVNLTD